MNRSDATAYAAVGAGLIAVAFGLARYAFGLFVPSMRDSLGLAPDTIGAIGSLAFVSFALASAFAPIAADRLGARGAATLAAALACAGLALIAAAGSATVLGAGVFTCGVATGLMMPALAAGAQAAIRPPLRGRVKAVMNAGTSLGLVACVPAVWWLGDAWRSAYAVFAAIAAIGVLAAWRRIPAASRTDVRCGEPAPPIAAPERAALARLVALGFAGGVAAAAFWIFAPDLVVASGGLSAGATGGLWLAIGIAGLAAGWASDLADRIGVAATHALALAGIAGGTALLAAAPGNAVSAIAAAALFGAAFMTLAGLHLVTAVRLLEHRPALGAVLPFLAITVGQAAGSPLAGRLIAAGGYVAAFQWFALLALAVAACSPLLSRRDSHAAAPARATTADVGG